MTLSKGFAGVPKEFRRKSGKGGGTRWCSRMGPRAHIGRAPPPPRFILFYFGGFIYLIIKGRDKRKIGGALGKDS